MARDNTVINNNLAKQSRPVNTNIFTNHRKREGRLFTCPSSHRDNDKVIMKGCVQRSSFTVQRITTPAGLVARPLTNRILAENSLRWKQQQHGVGEQQR